MDIVVSYIIYSIVIKLSLILCGSLFVYLGYKLFHPIFSVDSQEVVEASFSNVKILMKRVAPGTVFAAFGFGIVVTVILSALPSLSIEGFRNGSIDKINLRGQNSSDNKLRLSGYNRHILAAKKHIQNLEFDGTLSEIASSLKIRGLLVSESVSALNILAEVRLKQTKYSEALQIGMLVTTIDPSNAFSYAIQSLAEAGIGNGEVSVKLKARALDMDAGLNAFFRENQK